MAFTIHDDNDNEITLPSKWAICELCEGDGHHHYGKDDDQISEECDACDGSGKVRVLDRDKCTDEQLREYEIERLVAKEDHLTSRAEHAYCFGVR